MPIHHPISDIVQTLLLTMMVAYISFAVILFDLCGLVCISDYIENILHVLSTTKDDILLQSPKIVVETDVIFLQLFCQSSDWKSLLQPQPSTQPTNNVSTEVAWTAWHVTSRIIGGGKAVKFT